MTLRLTLAIGLLALALQAFGFQTESPEPDYLRTFDEQQFDQYANDQDFRYLQRNPPGKNWSAMFWDWVEKQMRKLYNAPYGATFFDNAPLVLSIGITAYVLYLWFGKGTFSPFYRNTQHFHTFETLADSPTDVLAVKLQDAKAQGNWVLALRCQFVLMVNELQQAGVLVHKPDKTNPEYIREMPAGKPRELFRSMANMFDFVHYGQFPCSQADFLQFEEYYQALKAEQVKA